jgi:hypothetical protein
MFAMLDNSFVIAELRAQNRELGRELLANRSLIESMYMELTHMHITSTVAEVTPRSVYKHFRGSYYVILVNEVVSRYLETIPDPSSSYDRQTAINIIKKVGSESNSGLLICTNGSRITFGNG